jgi:hypothetical protein
VQFAYFLAELYRLGECEVGVVASGGESADVQYIALHGTRAEKLTRLKRITRESPEWAPCRKGMQSTFRIAPAQSWDAYPALGRLMPARSRGITAGRSWVYAPTHEILSQRWDEFIAADVPRRREMFHEKSRRDINQILPPLPGFPAPAESLANESGPCPEPVQVAYRSFDRQWLIPDKRLLAEARTGLWRVHSERQIYVSEQDVQRIESGPGLMFTALIPDIDHFGGWGGGGVRPLWYGSGAEQANLAPGLLNFLSTLLGIKLSPVDFLAYVAAVVAHPAYTARFRRELEEPGIHVPLSAKPSVWESALPIGRQIIWLQTYGSRCVDRLEGRSEGERTIIDRANIKCTRAVRALPGRLPDDLPYNESSGTVQIGDGEFSPVLRRVVEYDVAGRRVLWRWLNDRTRQPRFKKRTAPELDSMTVTNWNRRLTDELLALLSVLTEHMRMENAQLQLLDEVCDSPIITVDDLRHAGVGLGSAALSLTDFRRREGTSMPSLFSA